tara:strand:- start:1411 stop:1839 length:429 start_codon:yes stop_codon:yes gene_type:complete
MSFFGDKWNNFLVNRFFGGKKEGILNELDQASKDPKKEAINAMVNLDKQYDQLLLNMAKICERNPNHPMCAGVDSYETALEKQKVLNERLKNIEQKELRRQLKWKNPNKWYTYDNWFVIVFFLFPPLGIYGGIMRLKNKNPA